MNDATAIVVGVDQQHHTIRVGHRLQPTVLFVSVCGDGAVRAGHLGEDAVVVGIGHCTTVVGPHAPQQAVVTVLEVQAASRREYQRTQPIVGVLERHRAAFMPPLLDTASDVKEPRFPAELTQLKAGTGVKQVRREILRAAVAPVRFTHEPQGPSITVVEEHIAAVGRLQRGLVRRRPTATEQFRPTAAFRALIPRVVRTGSAHQSIRHRHIEDRAGEVTARRMYALASKAVARMRPEQLVNGPLPRRLLIGHGKYLSLPTTGSSSHTPGRHREPQPKNSLSFIGTAKRGIGDGGADPRYKRVFPVHHRRPPGIPAAGRCIARPVVPVVGFGTTMGWHESTAGSEDLSSIGLELRKCCTPSRLFHRGRTQPPRAVMSGHPLLRSPGNPISVHSRCDGAASLGFGAMRSRSLSLLVFPN